MRSIDSVAENKETIAEIRGKKGLYKIAETINYGMQHLPILEQPHISPYALTVLKEQ